MSRNVCRVIGCLVVGWLAIASSSIAQAVTVMSMPDTAQGATGAIVQVPISAAPADGVFGIDMTVTYNPAVLEAQNVTVSGIAASAGFSLIKNLNTPGTIIISMFGPGDPLAGSGAIAQIQFHVLGAAATTSALTFTSVVLNEGHIPASLDNGFFTVPALGALLSMPDNAQGSPAAVVQVPISITPGTGVFGIDMTVTYDPAVLQAQNVTVTGIAASAGFSLIRNLNTPGTIIISMFAPGDPLAGSGAIAQIQFLVVGAQGTTSPLTFTSAAINEGSIPATFDNGLFSVPTVGALLSMPDTANGGPGAVVQVPISIVPGDGVLGVDMTITYDPAVLTAQNVTVSGIGSTAGFAVIRNLNTPGTIVITTYATGDPMVGSGEFLRIQFLVVGIPGTTSNLAFTSASINEGQIPATTDNGFFTVTCAGAANGTACTDGDSICTTGDTCQLGVCVGTPLSCDDGNTCTVDSCTPGVGCAHTPGNGGAVCRPAAGECDVAETCTGTAAACPADLLRTSGTSCADDGNACTADQCNGSSTSCQHPAGNAGAVCRPSAGPCDVAETCSGVSTTCPADAFASSATPCTGTSNGGACDGADHCSGTANTCVDAFLAATTTCRPSTGQCDVAESCTGSSGVCPTNGFQPSSTTCVGTSNGGACDGTDSCDGAGNCVDGFLAATTTCRPSTGQCDVAESCTGTSGTCPTDGFRPSTSACVGTSTGGACDGTDSCDGAGNCVDGFLTATTTCRPSTGQCDVAESCSGTSGTCPTDGFRPSTSSCVGTSTGGACDGTDSCDGAGNCVDGFLAATTTCRPSTGTCDVAESCTGSSGACPANGFRPSTTSCVGASNTGACDGTDSCDGAGNCVDGFLAATTTCRPSTGQCDVAESCTGTSGTCPTNGFQPSTTSCTGSSNSGACDGTDSCDGAGNCVDGFLAATTTCRPSTGTCDVAESCTGTSGTCPANGFRPSTTSCVGTSNTGACDGTDSCDGAGNCVDGFLAATTTCRPSTGACDVAESCNGTSGTCPANGFQPSTTSCTGTSNTGACDGTDSCDGAGNCVDGFLAATTTCRPSTGACDVAESCTGSSGICPTDGFRPSTTSCTGTSNGGVCDGTDSCDGAGHCVDGFLAATTTCRPSTGACDVAESCTGTSGTCPANGFQPSTTSCVGTSSTGACDGTDSCDGAGNCVDGFLAATTTCRPSTGQCDVAESCTGTSGTCPANGFRPSTTSCVGTSNTGACDGTDSCDGAGNCVDGFLAATTTCRPSTGACDVAESCTGTSGTCPSNGFQPSTTSCVGTSNTGACDGTDSCDGAGNCVDGFLAATTTCRPSTGACDVAESCTGTSGVCPTNGFQPSTTSCTGSSNGGACDGTDSCDGAGNCVDGFLAATTTCRPSTGACDVAESCTGTSGVCPTDGFRPSTTSCTGTSNGGVCDGTDSCDGAGHCVDGFLAATTTCRPSTGQCDVAESCTGNSGTCPANGFQPSTTTCVGTSTSGACDGTDSCDGAGNCVDGFLAATTTCRPSTGACDVAESCTGTSGVCPTNGFQPSTTSCTGSSNGGACDGTDSCDGAGNCVDGFLAATTTCRPSTGACDVAESCTGTSGVCPTDGFRPSTTSCTGTSNGGVCDGTDSCDGAGHCVDGFLAATTTCRPSTGQCDVAESCTGNSGTCPANGFQPSTTTCVGTSTSGACDGTDSCDGAGNCVDGFLAATTTCRPSTGACDVAESCTGTSGVCPTNGFQPSTTSCTGSSNGGACDGTDSCDGAGNCVDGFLAATTTCRPSTGACDVAESCTGTSGVCPTDGFRPSTTSCTGTSNGGVCDGTDSCDGAGHCVDGFLAATTTCRPSTGACDVAESCTGTSGTCPANGFQPSTTSCTGTSNTGACDGTDSCDGAGNCVDGFLAATTTCRPSTGQCDLAESCTGTSGTCPANGFRPSTTSCVGTSNTGACDGTDSCDGAGNCVDGFLAATTTCRPSTGACDVAESCNGTSGTCPPNGFQPSTTSCTGTSNTGACDGADSCDGAGNCVDGFLAATTTCRPSTGPCDVAESCNGTSGTCPANGFQPSTTSCVGTSNTGACDGTDSCDGAGNCVDGFLAATTTCRPSTGACDVAESCNGTSGTCPPNGFQPSTTSCTGTSNTGACDGTDSCDGAGNCVDGFLAATTTCRPSTGQCDVAESCTGTSGTCPANGFVSNGTSCNDNDPTTCTDVCTAGSCAGTPVAEPLALDDSLLIGKDVGGGADITWTDVPGPYNVYRGSNQAEVAWQYNQTCFVHETAAAGASDAANPPAGTLFYYLVSRVSACRESILGRDSNGVAIPNNNPCEIMP